jgi:hypothetical protein
VKSTQEKKDAATKDAATKDAATKDAATKDAATKDAATKDAATKDAATKDAATKDAVNEPHITRVCGALRLGQRVEVTVEPLAELLKQTKGDVSKIVLYLDGYPLPGLAPIRKSIASVKPTPSPTEASDATTTDKQACGTGDDANVLIFRLKPSDKQDGESAPAQKAREIQQQSLNALLGRPTLGFFPPDKLVGVSVGLENGPLETSVKNYPLVILPLRWFWLHVFLLLAVLISFLVLAVGSDLLRDGGGDPVEQPARSSSLFGITAMLQNVAEYIRTPNHERRPYSLARTQLAVWFLVIFAAFVFIWLVTGRLDSLTTQALALLGISSGTALGAAVIDANKRAAAKGQREELERAAADASDPDKQKRAATALAESQAASTKRHSVGFWTDILSDENGVTFHRFQVLAWTLVLVIVFIASVYNTLAMPQFDGTLLGLLGLSSGTFLGFKIPEASPTNPKPPDTKKNDPADKKGQGQGQGQGQG